MSATAQTGRQLGQHSHLGPSWYSPSLSAHSGPEPLGGYCYLSHIGRQTGVNPCGLSLTLPPTDRSGPDRLFQRGIADLDGWRSQRQTRHVDWNSRLNTRWRKLLLDYADENSCLVFRPDSPTTNPHNPSVTPHVLDIAITKQLTYPVYPTSCSELSSDHFPVLIDTSCRSSFHHPPDPPDFRHTDRANFQTQLEELIPSDPELHGEMANDTYVQNFSGAVLKALAAPTPKRRQRDDPRPPISAAIQD